MTNDSNIFQKCENLCMLNILAIPNNDNGMMTIEWDMIEPSLFPGHNGLRADWVIFVDMEVKDVDFAIHGHSCEHRAGIGRPRHIAHLGIQVEHEEWFPRKNYILYYFRFVGMRKVKFLALMTAIQLS